MSRDENIGDSFCSQSNSVSQALLRYAAKYLNRVSHEQITAKLNRRPFLEIADIDELPLFDSERYLSETAVSQEIHKYREQIENSKAVIFAVNECEHG